MSKIIVHWPPYFDLSTSRADRELDGDCQGDLQFEIYAERQNGPATLSRAEAVQVAAAIIGELHGPYCAELVRAAERAHLAHAEEVRRG